MTTGMYERPTSAEHQQVKGPCHIGEIGPQVLPGGADTTGRKVVLSGPKAVGAPDLLYCAPWRSGRRFPWGRRVRVGGAPMTSNRGHGYPGHSIAF